jgi:hypothetical protein
MLNQLDVSMPHGALNFSSATIPKKIQLNIGDGVLVTGQRAFLTSAQFSNKF